MIWLLIIRSLTVAKEVTSVSMPDFWLHAVHLRQCTFYLIQMGIFPELSELLTVRSLDQADGNFSATSGWQTIDPSLMKNHSLRQKQQHHRHLARHLHLATRRAVHVDDESHSSSSEHHDVRSFLSAFWAWKGMWFFFAGQISISCLGRRFFGLIFVKIGR